MPTIEELKAVFEQAKINRSNLFHAGEEELAAQEGLKKKEAEILNTVDAKTLGANEAARGAKLREMAAPERQALELSSHKKRKAQLAYELACLSVDCAKWMVRFAELGKE